MRSKDTTLKQEIYDFVNGWKRDYGASPSLKKIADQIQDILGHVDISTTMNIYVDAMDEMKQKEIAKYITKPEDVDNMTIQDLNRITMMKIGFVNP